MGTCKRSLRSTKENTYYSCTVHYVVTVLYAMRFHGLDAILDRPGTFCLDLMCSVPGSWYLFCDTRSRACVASVSVRFRSKE